MPSTQDYMNQVQSFICSQIPLSEKLGFRLETLELDRSQIFFPLKPNLNHKGTAFGGSIYMACTLAAYALFFNGLREMGFQTNDILISKGEISYSNPTTADFQVVATWEPDQRDSFAERLKLKKRARVKITAEVRCLGETCCIFYGEFVARI